MSMENHGRMISTGKLLIRPPELSGNPTSSHIVANKGEFGEGSDTFCLRRNFVHTYKCFFYMP
jgi:hypothetical protein